MRAVAAPAMRFAAEMLGLGRGAGLQLASEQVERAGAPGELLEHYRVLGREQIELRPQRR